MEVRPGYKQTEVGVIPEDWEVQTLGPNCERVTKGTTPTSIGRAFTDAGVTFLKAESISATGRAIPDKVAFIDDATHALLGRSQLRDGDVLVSIAGVLGRIGLVEKADLPANTNQALAIVRLDKNSQLSRRFLFYCLRSSVVSRQIRDISVQAAQANISLQNVSEFLLPIPPTTAEQEAIVEVLSDADAHIESLEHLLAKKRDVKQGAMQELLTGKKRLPGFAGGWEVKRLGDVGDISGAGVDKKSRPGELPVRLVNYLDVYRKDFIYSYDLDHWVTAPTTQAWRCSVKKGDVFFTPSSETRDDIGISAVAMEDIPDAVYSYHVVRLRLKDAWDLRFRTYVFKTRAFLAQAETLCDGNGTRYVVSQGKFRSMTVRVPPVREQTAIAEVLSDMDAEINALEARLAKARELKEGMMQELLTGRIRLV